MLLQGFLAVVYVLFTFLPLGPVNGWPKIADLEDRDTGPAKFGIFCVVLESITYMLLTALAVWLIYLFKTEAHKGDSAPRNIPESNAN